MTKFTITDRNTTYDVHAADEDTAVLVYAELVGLTIGQDFADAADLKRQNDLFIEECES